MTAETKSSGGTTRLFALLSALACFLLGAIALYSSGLGLIDPKLHRAAGFALALIAGVSAARAKREAGGPLTGAQGSLHLVLDVAMIAAGLWAIWSFH
ncbi:hypothetical protein, partial [uncultured Tateyamaria sp.]